MHKLQILIFVLAIFTVMVGCKKPDHTINPGDCQAIFVNDNGFENAPQDEFTFGDMNIENDCLTINVGYGGGCGKVTFELYLREPLWLPILPTLEAKLSFKDKDNCEAYIRKDIQFDLSEIQDYPGASGNEMTLQFTGVGAGKSIKYTW